jgi:hypothetical protein
MTSGAGSIGRALIPPRISTPRGTSRAPSQSRGTSVARGQTLGALPVPEQDPDPSWFLAVLADAPLPRGVRAGPRPQSNATTLCTFIADLTAGQAVIANRDERPVTIPLRDLAEGHPHGQRQLSADRGR